MANSISEYFQDGCGRCAKVASPQCNVRRYADVLAALTALLRQSELQETIKWGQPCYVWQGQNVVMLAAFNDYCVLSFFQGVLLTDPSKRLVQAGEHTQAARQWRFSHVAEVSQHQALIEAYLQQAKLLAARGEKVQYQSQLPEFPEELTQAMADDRQLAESFAKLTPGRQRGYLLHFTSAKQAKTRQARVAKYREQIIAGKGLDDK